MSFKRYVALGILAACSSGAYASPASNLLARLSKINTYQANYTQKTLNKTTLLQTSTGNIEFNAAGIVKVTIKTPHQYILYTKNATLYSYNAFLDQVTVSHLNAQQNPFTVLYQLKTTITNYSVVEHGNLFSLTPKNSTLNKLTAVQLRINQQGRMTKFLYTANDITNIYNFHSIKLNDKLVISFTIPQGATVNHQSTTAI